MKDELQRRHALLTTIKKKIEKQLSEASDPLAASVYTKRLRELKGELESLEWVLNLMRKDRYQAEREQSSQPVNDLIDNRRLLLSENKKLKLENSTLETGLSKCQRRLTASLDRETELEITIKTLRIQTGEIPREEAEKIMKEALKRLAEEKAKGSDCLLYTSPSPRD